MSNDFVKIFCTLQTCMILALWLKKHLGLYLWKYKNHQKNPHTTRLIFLAVTLILWKYTFSFLNTVAITYLWWERGISTWLYLPPPSPPSASAPPPPSSRYSYDPYAATSRASRACSGAGCDGPPLSLSIRHPSGPGTIQGWNTPWLAPALVPTPWGHPVWGHTPSLEGCRELDYKPTPKCCQNCRYFNLAWLRELQFCMLPTNYQYSPCRIWCCSCA